MMTPSANGIPTPRPISKFLSSLPGRSGFDGLAVGRELLRDAEVFVVVVATGESVGLKKSVATLILNVRAEEKVSQQLLYSSPQQ